MDDDELCAIADLRAGNAREVYHQPPGKGPVLKLIDGNVLEHNILMHRVRLPGGPWQLRFHEGWGFVVAEGDS